MDTRQKIKASAEAKAYSANIKLLTAAYLFLLFVSAVLVCIGMAGLANYWNTVLLIFIGFVTVLYVPFIVYYVAKYAALFKSPESCVFSDQVLEEFKHTGFLGNRVTFPVAVRDANGNPVKAWTSSVYCTNWKRPRYEDFYRKKVTVGYNTVTGQVILIGPDTARR